MDEVGSERREARGERRKAKGERRIFIYETWKVAAVSDKPVEDGVHALVPREKMCEGARKMRDFYAITPGAPLCRREFSFFTLERWRAEEGMPQEEEVPLKQLFPILRSLCGKKIIRLIHDPCGAFLN